MKTARSILALLLVPLLILSTAPPLYAAVTGRTEDTSLAGTEKVLMDSSGVDTWALISTIRAVGAMTSGTITGTTISGLTVSTTTGTLTIPDGVTLTGPAASGTAATLAGSETLSNKTINLTSNTLSATSLQLKTAISDESGSGALVFATSPTLVTPTLGVATATTVNKITITAPASGATLTIPDGVVFSGPSSTGTAATLANAETLTNKTIAFGSNTISFTSAQLITACSNETGTGALVFGTSPTLTTPTLGVASATTVNKITITAPASGATLTIPDGVTLTGPASSGTAATLANAETLTNKTFDLTDNTLTGTSAELRAAISDETGTGVAVFATSPTLVTPTLGVASATTVNKITITAPATGATLTIPDGVTLTGPSASGTAATLAGTETLTNKTISLTSNTISGTSAELRTLVSDETGTGVAVFATSPSLVTPSIAAYTMTGTGTIGAGLTATSPALVTPTIKDLTEVVTAANVITAAETGSVFFLSSATEFASTLPAVAAGLHFTFIVTAAPSGANYTIVAASGTPIKGHVITTDVNSATDPDFATTGVLTINIVDGKAVAGDMVELWCDGTNWFATAKCTVFDAITFD